MRWDAFAAAAPELAGLGEERLRAKELCLVGTLRKNGCHVRRPALRACLEPARRTATLDACRRLTFLRTLS
jgi:hypothetical protein